MSLNLSDHKLANATIKNRAEYSQLHTELKRIEKEKRTEMKMLHNEKLRFKAKYTKAHFGSETSDASDVKMYQTHNPGFCFKRNGEHRVPLSVSSSPPVDFEHLQFLLFTNGEVDIEKVLCLHLLSSHETEHLTRPKTNNLTKTNSPIEQLIERSKDYEARTSSASILPTYVLDVKSDETPSKQKEDDRLSERLIINEKISELITTVIRALEQSNPEKVQQLMSAADDPSSLKRIFRRPYIQDFILLLKEHSLVNSCSSFILTQPTKTRPNHIQIRTATGVLEDLVKFIRSNVLQFPNRSTWKMLEADSRDRVTIQPSPPPVKKNIDTRKIRSPVPPQMQEEEIEIGHNKNRFRRISRNFVAHNIATFGLPPSKKAKRDSVESRKAEEMVKIKKSMKRETKRQSIPKEDIKVHIKQTTCPACMEKWKQPLPSPKVSTVNRNVEFVEGGLKTNSLQRLSMLIEREQFKLDSYDRRYSNLSNTSSLSPSSRRKASQGVVIEKVELNVRDLEKIRQAVREKETKKKLEKFLGD